MAVDVCGDACLAVGVVGVHFVSGFWFAICIFTLRESTVAT